MLVPHLLKMYFGLGWPSSVLKIVSVTKVKNIFALGSGKDVDLNVFALGSGKYIDFNIFALGSGKYIDFNWINVFKGNVDKIMIIIFL